MHSLDSMFQDLDSQIVGFGCCVPLMRFKLGLSRGSRQQEARRGFHLGGLLLLVAGTGFGFLSRFVGFAS
ncbi:hypothetical protein N7E70_008905 [Aminobacter sp. NyZ550]|uniref:hypothetical protein n=1 Tax=Aminobacter sp. NyZ550 TaxID=2979870 RepID=UPI0021D5DC79|nr:hypothetical protein [Aminobacter sp. NyZ550]WAX96941.1 hypothetical protein N7E70_008905 [Aminobacter sp. NyZ550]